METNVFSLHVVKLDIILRWIWTFGATTLVDPSYPASIQIHCPFPCGIPKTTVLPGWSPVGIQHNPPPTPAGFSSFSRTYPLSYFCPFLAPQLHQHLIAFSLACQSFYCPKLIIIIIIISGRKISGKKSIYIDIYTYIYTDEENKWERLTQQFLLSNFCDCIVEFSSTLSYGPEN